MKKKCKAVERVHKLPETMIVGRKSPVVLYGLKLNLPSDTSPPLGLDAVRFELGEPFFPGDAKRSAEMNAGVGVFSRFTFIYLFILLANSVLLYIYIYIILG